ncbi:MAG: type I 3-dehydroquinate dehydratase [Thermodesulfobacteriota bacterium]
MKKLSGKDKYPGKICIVIAEESMERAFRALARANQLADLVELRLDYLSQPNLAELRPKVKKPLIVTNRLSQEGGKFKGSEEERIGLLQRAAELKASFIDVELASPPQYIGELLRHKKGVKIILSFHDFKKTGSLKQLQSLLDQMIELHADVAKIVTFARSWLDNLTILNLILYARAQKQKIVAFCMGEKGKISRLLSPLLGGAWTYVALASNKKAAPGQLSIRELHEIWRNLI